MVCLLEDKPEVQAQLNEYTEILGNADAAYYILSENNGYDLDRAPNGAPSKLFSDLLSLYNGDRNAAIQAKAKVYSESFKNWFGDWLSADKTNVSKVVDENGEPLIVYHHANNQFSEFSIEFDNYFSTLKGGTKKALFFTGTQNPASGTVLDRPYKMSVFLNAKVVIEKTGTKDQLREQGESFVTTINRAAEEADAAIFHGIDDNQEVNQDIYVINNPNNVKSIYNQGTFSIQDNNIYQNQVEETPESKKAINFYNIFDSEQYTGMTSREFITNVRSYFPSDNTTVNRLLDLFSRVDVPVKVVDSESLPQGKTYMYYNPTTGEITVAIDEFNKCSIGYNATSMLHELVHVFTYSSIEAAKKGVGTNLDKVVYDKLSSLYKQYKDLFYSVIQDGEVSGLFYGLKDEYEFVSELLTNSDFYNLLLDFANQRDTGIFNEIRKQKWMSSKRRQKLQYKRMAISNMQQMYRDFNRSNNRNNNLYMWFKNTIVLGFCISCNNVFRLVYSIQENQRINKFKKIYNRKFSRNCPNEYIN